MKHVELKCPKCNKRFYEENWFVWVLTAPFHWFGKRYTKCAWCHRWSWMKRLKRQ